MKKVKAVIFDMDGVIFDSESVWKMMFEKANEKYKLSLSEEYRQSICGKLESLIRSELKELLPGLDVDEYRDFIKNAVRKKIEDGEFSVKNGFFQIAEYLKKKGCKMALATSSDQRRAENMFRKKGIDETDLFDVRIYGNDVAPRSKPDPYIFQLAAQRLGLNCDECIVVEDSINGIKAAADGGFIPIMAVDLISPDEYCREKCFRIIDSLTKLIEIMEKEI